MSPSIQLSRYLQWNVCCTCAAWKNIVRRISLEEGELLEASKNVTNGVQGRFVHNKDSCQNFIVYHEFLETLYYYY